MSVFKPFDYPLQLPAALIVIDMQPVGVTPEAGLAKAIEDANPGYTQYLATRVREVAIPAISRLRVAFHDRGQPVVFTVFGSIVGDGTDVRTSTIRYRDAQRRAGTGVSVILPRSDPATDVIKELQPAPQDLVLAKTSMDSFASTDLAERLFQRGVKSVVISGVLSDACVESTARNAAEMGFHVFIAEDGCCAWEPGFHLKSMENLARYFARVESAAWIADAVAGAAAP